MEGIVLSCPEREVIQLKNDPFANMCNLRLLKICNVDFWGCTEYSLPENLRLLEWHECPLQVMPSRPQSTSLLELKLPKSYIERLWNDNVR